MSDELPTKPAEGIPEIKDLRSKPKAKLKELLGLVGKKAPKGYMTGEDWFDELTNGFQEIIVLGGEPDAGKTTLAIQLTLGALRENLDLRVLFYSLELSPHQLVWRLSEYYRNNEDLEDDMSGSIGERTCCIFSSELAVLKNSNKSIEKEIEENFNNQEVLIVIDNLHLLPSKETSVERWEGIMEDINFLRSKYPKSAWFLISQISKEAQRKKELADPFKGSTAILYTSRFAMVLRREEGKDATLNVEKNQLGKGRSKFAISHIDGKLIFETHKKKYEKSDAKEEKPKNTKRSKEERLREYGEK